MKRLVRLASATVAIWLSSAAFGAATRNVNTPFRYRFFGTDVVSWVNGLKTGPVSDNAGVVATALHGLLSGARTKVDLAAYGIQNQEWLFQDLAQALERGVDLRVVVDQEKGALGDWSAGNFTYPDTVRLHETIGDDRIIPDLNPDGTPRAGTIMHHKFVVVDQRKTWIGSANFSATCLGDEYNANVALLIDSPDVASIYSGEFRQMFDDHLFSRYKHARARPETLVFTDGTEVQVFFSPEDDAVNAAVLPFIEQTRRTLDLGLFGLTDQKVADALVRAANRGVTVRVIYDAVAAASPSSLHQYLRDHGVTVRVETWGGKMHMKGGVADGSNILVGSMNWSGAGANQNDENTLWVRGNAVLAGQLKTYLESLWDTLAPRTERYDARAESRDSLNSCSDGVDNDFDGAVDAADSGCR